MFRFPYTYYSTFPLYVPPSYFNITTYWVWRLAALDQSLRTFYIQTSLSIISPSVFRHRSTCVVLRVSILFLTCHITKLTSLLEYLTYNFVWQVFISLIYWVFRHRSTCVVLRNTLLITSFDRLWAPPADSIYKTRHKLLKTHYAKSYSTFTSSIHLET